MLNLKEYSFPQRNAQICGQIGAIFKGKPEVFSLLYSFSYWQLINFGGENIELKKIVTGLKPQVAC